MKRKNWLSTPVASFLALVLLGPGVLVSLAHGQVRDRSAWELLLPRQELLVVEVWQGQLAGGDVNGGLLLLDPETNELESLSTGERLTSNLVRCLAVDDAGSLWVGTADAGLNRVDPDRSVRPVTGVLDPRITGVAADGDFVYYGTPAGGGRISNGQPDLSFTVDFGLLSEDIRSVAARDGKAWFGTAEGVSEFDRQTSAFVDRIDGLTGGLIAHDLLATAAGTFAATDGGVFRLNETGTWEAWGTGLTESIQSIAAGETVLLALASGNRAWRLDAPGGAWTSIAPNAPDFVFNDIAEFDGSIWYAGQVRDATRQGNDPLATFWTESLTTPPTLRGLFGSEARGLSIDHDGGAWFGTTPVFDGVTHWRADGSVSAYNIEDPTPADGDDFGWLNALKIAVLETRAGDVFVSGFGTGVTRMRPAASDDPADAEYLHLRTASSPLQSRRVVRLAEDAAGHIWFGSDGENITGDRNAGIDILVDPSDPLSASSWVKVTSTNSELLGDAVFGIDFEAPNVAWLSVRGVGVQRWVFDPSGDGSQIDPASLNSPLDWRTVSILPEFGPGTELIEPRGVVFDRSGRMWIATLDQGVFRIPIPGSQLLSSSQVERLAASEFGLRLLSSQVRAITIDANDDLWVASDAGLDRVTERAGVVEVQAFTDFAAFNTRDLGQFYLPDVLSPLPGSNMRSLAIDRDRDLLFMGTQRAAARLSVGRLREAIPEELSFTVYPNPVRNGQEALYVTDFPGIADLKIYNVLGVLLHTSRNVEAGEAVWDLRTLSDSEVASGLYIVRLEQDGRVALRTLAVEK